MALMIDQFVPRSFLEALAEPSHGAPLVCDFDGLPFSASFRVNAGTSYRVHELLRRFGAGGRPLLICEIGAGWGGCATQLHQVRDIATYMLVDLPENLFLSSTYLAAVLPEATIEFLDIAGPAYTPGAGKRVVAMLPPAIGRLACRFDVILNSFSLQEMDADTVHAYLDWATHSLSDDGVLISFNAHGKAGIVRASEYRFGCFDVRHIGTFRRVPQGFFNTIPYEVVLRRRDRGSPAFDEGAFDVLADLIQLGLDDDLADFRDALVDDTLAPNQKAFLQALGDCLTADSDERRQTALSQAEALDSSAIVPFVRGNLQFAAGAFSQAESSLAAAERRLGGFAKLRCEVMRAVIDVRNGGRPRAERIFLPDDRSTAASALYPEIPQLIASGDASPMQNHIDRVLHRRGGRVPPGRGSLWQRAKRFRMAGRG